MRDAFSMCVIERLGDLHCERQRLRDGKGPSRDRRFERLAVDELQDQRADVARDFQPVDGADVRVTQRGEQSRFTLEPRQSCGIGREVRRQHLDRHITAKPVIVRAIHLAHAASADPDANLVGADVLPDRKAGRLSVRAAVGRIRQRVRGQLAKRRGKKRLCSGIPIEERSRLTSQLLVRAAGLCQERVTFVGRPLQRSVAELLEPSPAFCGTRHRENRSDSSAASPDRSPL